MKYVKLIRLYFYIIICYQISFQMSYCQHKTYLKVKSNDQGQMCSSVQVLVISEVLIKSIVELDLLYSGLSGSADGATAEISEILNCYLFPQPTYITNRLRHAVEP